MPTQVSLLDGALASAGTLAIQTNGTTSAITISSAQVATFVNNPIMTGLTASRAVFTDGSKGLTSNAITGTGNVVMSASPTLTGTIDGAALTLSSSLTLSGGTANGVLYLNGSKVATSGSALTFDGTNLGVGTSSPVSATGYTGFTVRNNTNGGIIQNTDGTVDLRMQLTPATTGDIGTYSNHPVRFVLNGSEQMRLTSTGLGIGTSSPANKLQVFASSSGTNDLLTISRFDRGSSGTAANGLGGRLEFSAQDNAGSQRTAAWLNWKLSDVSSGGPKGYLSLGSRGTSEALIIDDSGNLGLGVTPSNAFSGLRSFEIGANGVLYSETPTGIYNAMSVGLNFYYDSAGTAKYKNSSLQASRYNQYQGQHQWYTAASGTAGNAITFTQAATLDSNGNFMVGVTSTSYRMNATVQSGANRDVFAAQIAGASNGLTVKWNHATTTTRVNIANLPTSSAGLASGDLWNDGGTLKIA